MSHLIRLIIVVLFLPLTVSAQTGSDDDVLTIIIDEGTEGAVPIPIVPFGWSGDGAKAPEDLAAIISSNLERTGQFKPIPISAMPSQPSEPAEVVYRDWRILGTSNLVIGTIRQAGDQYNIQFRLFDVNRGQQLKGFQLNSSKKDLRRAAHQISDVIFEALTGEPGAFDTRIAYITQRKRAGGKIYTLNIADSDGFNTKPILESPEPVLSPSWSPNGENLAYVSFQNGLPRIYMQAIATGRQTQLSAFKGLNGAPAWSPDGAYIALTLSKDGNPEIYVMQVQNRRLRRLTKNAAIDTEPVWSPDGQSIVFTSDRPGKPQLYRISVNGGRAERITFSGKYAARPNFSPDGSKIAYVHGEGSGFQIGLLDLATNEVKVLTKTRFDESPSFAPNGSMILYATQDARGPVLAAVSADGRVRQTLGVKRGAVREPAWSPFR